jgi:hypothetical protein
MIQTLHDPSRIRPGDWIVIVRWPGTGVEIYAIKPHVRDAAYELGAAIPFDPVEES